MRIVCPVASMVLKGPLKIWAQKVSQNVSSEMFELNHASRHRNLTIPQQQRTHRRRRLLRVWVQMC